jgi:hypothetical protein
MEKPKFTVCRIPLSVFDAEWAGFDTQLSAIRPKCQLATKQRPFTDRELELFIAPAIAYGFTHLLVFEGEKLNMVMNLKTKTAEFRNLRKGL